MFSEKNGGSYHLHFNLPEDNKIYLTNYYFTKLSYLSYLPILSKFHFIHVFFKCKQGADPNQALGQSEFQLCLKDGKILCQ